MSSFLRLFGRNRREDVGIIAPSSEYVTGKYPDPVFSDLVQYNLRDPMVRAAVDDLAERAVGMGFYTTAKVKRAKDVIDGFCEEANLDEINMMCAKHCFGFGNFFLEMVYDKVVPARIGSLGTYMDPAPNAELLTLKPLPISMVSRIYRNRIGKVLAIEQRSGTDMQLLSPNIVIHYAWNVIDCAPFGTGLIQTLALPGKGMTRTDKSGNQEWIQRPAFLAMKEEYENMMRDFLRRYIGRFAFVWKNEKAANVQTYMSSISKLKENQDIGVGTAAPDSDFTVIPLSLDPRAQFDPILRWMETQTVLGLQTPVMKLFTTPGFTEASAKEATGISDRKIAAFQRFLKRTIERRIFRQVLIQNNLNPDNAELRLNWGMQQQPEVTIDHILKLAELSGTLGIEYIRPEELRKNLIKVGFELWEPEPQQPTEPGVVPTGGS